MADAPYAFRSALGGFHKGDVAAYIEKTAIAHRTEILEHEKVIAQLQEENRSLHQQLNLLMMATPLPTAAAPAAAPAAEPKPAPQAEPAPAPQAAAEPLPLDASELMQMELQAYRRAEAVERKAGNCARKLYQQLEGVCDSALDEFRLTDAAVKSAIEAMLQQANALEQAYQTLSASLNNSREKLAAMNLLPDDSE